MDEFEQKKSNLLIPTLLWGIGLLILLLLLFFSFIKSAECSLEDNLPDSNCTPGSIIDVSIEELCLEYREIIVSDQLRAKVYARYGIKEDNLSYEIDHFIPLSLGGSDSVDNLWPQPIVFPGYIEKNNAEQRLYTLVCTGRMQLSTAQDVIRQWQKSPGIWT